VNEELLKVSVLVVLTTCNTVPTVLVVNTVPVTAGSVSVRLLAVLGSCKVTLPPPEEFSFRLMVIL